MKPEDNYRNLIRRIHAPEDAKQNILNEASTRSAREDLPQSAPEEVPVRHSRNHSRRGTVVRLAAAAACACLALTAVRSGISKTYSPENAGGHSPQTASVHANASAGSEEHPVSAPAAETSSPVSAVKNFFCLAAPFEVTAEAASLENRASLALHSDDGDENFTGNEFYIRGQNIESVTLRLSRDGFYLASEMKTSDEHEAMAFPEKQNGQDAERSYTVSYDPADDGGSTVYTLRELKHCGQEITLKASELSSTAIGFYTPASYTNSISAEDPKTYLHECTDYVNGASMSVTITYNDGSEESQTYTLETGKLRVRYDENGQEAEDEFIRSENEPWLYGVLITKQS